MNKVIILFLISIYSFSQDLTGTWITDPNQAKENFYGELHLVHDTKKEEVKGYSFDIIDQGYCKHTFDGQYNKKEKKLVAQNIDIIDKTENHTASIYNLKYIKEKGEEYLIGHVNIKPKNYISSTGGVYTGIVSNNESETVRYKKESKESKIQKANNPIDLNNFDGKKYNYDNSYLEYKNQETEPIQSKESKKEEPQPDEYFPFADDKKEEEKVAEVNKPEIVVKEETPKLDAYLSEQDATERKNSRKDVLSNVYSYKKGEIKFEIYDYGNEDGDVVSVFYNDKVLVSNLEIKKEKYSFNLDLDENAKHHKVVFVAHNLGEIPPNTGEVKIHLDGKTYSQKISSDESKNSVIEFRSMY
ncbi:MAG: hypothetical protein H6604_02060 [Flavobacteriales bacterium]|nr:hypothetical protein [Flavobacteriales bacterium]